MANRAPQLGRFLTSTQAAAYVGISRPALYKLVENREVASYRVLTHLRFTREDLDAYLDRIRTPSRHETKARTQRKRSARSAPKPKGKRGRKR